GNNFNFEGSFKNQNNLLSFNSIIPYYYCSNRQKQFNLKNSIPLPILEKDYTFVSIHKTPYEKNFVIENVIDTCSIYVEAYKSYFREVGIFTPKDEEYFTSLFKKK